MKLTLTALFCLMPLLAQDAKIMILDKADSDHLSSAYQNYLSAKKTWEQVKTYVSEKYTVDVSKPEILKDGKTVKNYKDGWDKVQFSADFRALVPDQSPYAAHYPGCYNTGYYLYPSTGTWNNTGIAPTLSTGATGSSVLTDGSAGLKWTGSSNFAVNDNDGVTINGDLKVVEPAAK